MCFYSLTVVLVLGALFGDVHATSASPLNGENSPIRFLRLEMASCSLAQSSIKQFLHSRGIPVGEGSAAVQKNYPFQRLQQSSIHDRIIRSTDSNNIECRISLERAPVGAICVAPCGCSGSQKWVQFTELNKLRRKDPKQWITCQTCQQPFNYAQFSRYGGVAANLIGVILDNKVILRTLVAICTSIVMTSPGTTNAMKRVLTSFHLWQMYPQWSKLTRLPLALKFWILKLLLQYGFDKYQQLESSILISYLTDIETRMIEENIPLSNAI